MKTFFALIVIIATLVIAGKQPASKFGRAVLIIFCGLWILSLIFKLPDTGDQASHRYSESYTTNRTVAHTGSRAVPQCPPVNRTPAMSKETAERLSGTGYHGCRPNSSAENSELKAAQNKCSECGYYTSNGGNSLCDYCKWQFLYGNKK